MKAKMQYTNQNWTDEKVDNFLVTYKAIHLGKGNLMKIQGEVRIHSQSGDICLRQRNYTDPSGFGYLFGESDRY